MPLHGIFSCITPASYVYGLSTSAGGGGGYGPGGGGMAFPSWFGKNSTQGKLQRLLGEIQIRMRLKVSGDRKEIRQSYLPILYPKLFKPLVEDGEDAVEEIIELMDDYYLTKEEWDAMVEIMALGKESYEDIMKAIPTKVKSAFTRMCVSLLSSATDRELTQCADTTRARIRSPSTRLPTSVPRRRRRSPGTLRLRTWRKLSRSRRTSCPKMAGTTTARRTVICRRTSSSRTRPSPLPKARARARLPSDRLKAGRLFRVAVLRICNLALECRSGYP